MFDIHTKLGIKQGNPAAFKEVFRLLYPRLKGYCKLFIKDESQVDDLIQESFIALWENKNAIRPEKSIESFVFVIIRNRCLNHLKKQKLEEGKIELDNLNTSQLQYLYQLDFTEKEEASMEELLIVSLRKAVDELPGKMKNVFVKCKIEGRKQADVAEELNISIKMVEKHIAKAKQQIRKTLIREYPALLIVIALILEA